MARHGDPADPVHVAIDSGGPSTASVVTIADGADVTQGAAADASGANTVIGKLKALAASLAVQVLSDVLSRTQSVPIVGAANLLDDGTQLVRQRTTPGSSRIGVASSGLHIFASGDWQQVGAGNSDGTPNYQGVVVVPSLYSPSSSNLVRPRQVEKFKDVTDTAIVAGTPLAGWTPAAGKKFRIMRGQLSLSVAGQIILKDGATEILRSPKLAAGGIWDLSEIQNGQLSAAANNVLNIDVSANGNVGGWVGGTEE